MNNKIQLTEVTNKLIVDDTISYCSTVSDQESHNIDMNHYDKLIPNENRSNDIDNTYEDITMNIARNMSINISKWNEFFINYVKIEDKCIEDINNILEIKNSLDKLLGNQKKDDIDFYKSIIDSSYYYLTSSLKIRKHKILKDLNEIWIRINPNKSMVKLDKSNFTSLIKDYEKLSKDIYNSRINNTTLAWVKNDTIDSLQKIENSFNEIIIYHSNLISYLSNMTHLDKTFYCSRNK